MKTIEFTGKISGDMECFCWDECSINTKFRQPGRLYPGDIWKKLDCEQGKKYKFTIKIEDVDK